ncbi:IPT/TIG domain-containing protein [Rufibacter sediminis]|uniref:IPT/TIG domain-containing protein n=1 Tax=Rufibacter sediminis TaxID=2762756 RepID=A0ABR6VQF2_9BACT|nr:IPT/TIG domain-containing protein [Rufibacter sediminis]MBC3539417.1 IPT/TIG domain-containing protein [Rufibacter sediminis]
MKQSFTRPFSFIAKNLSSLLLVVLGFLMAPGVQAQDVCQLIPLSLEERVQAAQVVVEGKVISQRSFWDEKHENIYTASQVEVYKVFKGEPTATTVEIITEGGRVDMDLHVYSATLSLKKEQQGVFFLQSPKPSPKAKLAKTGYTVFGSTQGFIKYQLTEGTAKDPFTRYASIPLEVYGSLARLSGRTLKAVKANTDLDIALKPKPATQNQRRSIPTIDNFSPKSLRAGTGDVLTITGTNFGSTRGNGYVEFRNSDDGGKTFVKPLATDYLGWSDTQIRVKVPSYGIDGGTAGTGDFRVVNNDPNTATSASPLNIIFAHSNVSYESEERKIEEQSVQTRLISQNGQGGYTFRFGASFEANTAALYAFKRSMNEWSCTTFVNWNTVSNNPVANTADDNINAVRFATASDDLPANVLGRTISRYRGCISGTVLNFWVDEIDMEFAQRSDWQYGPDASTNRQFDFQSVVVHELGHGHQLSHLILPKAVMHYAVARGQSSRTLNPENDIAGGNYVMERSRTASPCGEKPMEPKPANACAIPVELIELEAELTVNNQVLLQWTTQQENGITAFAVERSPDGETYTTIGTVPASGTSTTPTSYEFLDTSPLTVLNYYRLRLIRANTVVEEYSEVVQVAGPNFVRQIAPNPGGNETTLFFNTTEKEVLHLAIFNTAGQLYREWSLEVTPESNKYDITLFPAQKEGKTDMYPTRRGLFLIKWSTKQENGVIRYLKLE